MQNQTPIAFLALAGLFAMLTLAVQASAATTNTITANVAVFCPFAVTLNALPVYTASYNTIFNFSIETLAQCTISSLPGQFTLTYTPNSMVVYNDPITIGSVTQTNTLYYTSPVNMITFDTGNYVAEVSFQNSFESNSSSVNTQIINGVNITVENLSVSPANPTLGSTATISVGIKNIGGLASNTIGINMLITGPARVQVSQSAPALSPQQGEVISIQPNGATSATGQYNVLANATFTNNALVITSANLTTSYTVSSGGTGNGPPVPKQQLVTPVPNIQFTSFESYSTVNVGSVTTTNLGFGNPGTVPVFVNFSYPGIYARYLSLSSNTIYLSPGSGGYVQAAFNAIGAKPGMYYIPLNISTAIVNGTDPAETEYLTYEVTNQTPGTTGVLSRAVTIGINSTTVSHKYIAPYNESLRNATLITDLPTGIVSNISEITTFGLPANVSLYQGHPRITWSLAYLAPGQTAYFSYTVTNPSNPNLFQNSYTALFAPSKAAPSSILKLVNIEAPTFYTNTTDKITVQVLYTGTTTQQMTIALTPPSTTVVKNPVQTFNVTPNQLVTAEFSVPAGQSQGTLLFQVYVASGGANLSYSLPVLVTQKPSTTATTTVPLQPQVNIPISISQHDIVALGEGLAIVVIVIAIYYLARKGVERPKYRKERSEELIRIREQIKRSDKFE